jgi:hypothetical protein
MLMRDRNGSGVRSLNTAANLRRSACTTLAMASEDKPPFRIVATCERRARTASSYCERNSTIDIISARIRSSGVAAICANVRGAVSTRTSLSRSPAALAFGRFGKNFVEMFH